MPGTAGGTRRRSSFSVYSATRSGVSRLGQSAPGVTMEGLRRMPSKMTPWSAMYLNVSAQISSATSRVRSMSCSPSSRTSGSMMGTRPAAWEMAP